MSKLTRKKTSARTAPLKEKKATPKPSPWLPIRKAPKDGTWILVKESAKELGFTNLVPFVLVTVSWRETHLYKSGGYWEDVLTGGKVNPKEYMDLPEGVLPRNPPQGH